tara:strand:+ start:1415 stop:1825 length:411 start_codon:yes stop_codon:yes gene_type:complete
MTTTFKGENFRKQLEKAYKEKVEGRASDAMRQYAADAFGQIIQNTPVDKGRAKNNWNISLNSVDPSITDAANPNRAGTNEAISATLNLKLNDTVFISNNLPYIQRLNDGYSLQAPENFVESAVQVAENRLRERLKK